MMRLELPNMSLSGMSFNRHSFIAIGDTVALQPLVTVRNYSHLLRNLVSAFKLSANISRTAKGGFYEIIFAMVLKSSSRIQYVTVGMLPSEDAGAIELDIWNLPIGWSRRQPISSTFVNFQSISSHSNVLTGKWQIITFER